MEGSKTSRNIAESTESTTTTTATTKVLATGTTDQTTIVTAGDTQEIITLVEQKTTTTAPETKDKRETKDSTTVTAEKIPAIEKINPQMTLKNLTYQERSMKILPQLMKGKNSNYRLHIKTNNNNN